MNTDEFTNLFWSQYISLEKEFTETLHYVALDVNNESVYSQAYSKLMLEIGSEVDVVFKEYCRTIDPEFKKKNYRTMDRYRDCVIACNPGFVGQKVSLINYNRIIEPWGDCKSSPCWWTAYNAVKHNRIGTEEIDGVKQEGFKFATQKYTLHALAGLFQIMVFFFNKLAIEAGEQIVTPMPGSRLFKLSGGVWDSVSFYGDSAFVVDEGSGHLIWTTSSIHY